ncbi:ABC transporter permease [Georgenia faecalis]|uniref:ABC transporter permease n=1 Tax=Georgenia faecalis TaxID=2483799 RepID=A0ABV9DAV4_9MICO|nr:ABC transporter permease [Georgenia faecalis]
MPAFIARRVGQAAIALFGVLMVAFFLLRVLPGDPAALMLSEFGTPEQIDDLRESMGLNEPLPVQFLAFIGQVLTGDFGESLARHRPALVVVLEYLPATLQLACAALLLTVLVAVPLGTLAALRRGTWVDGVVSVLAVLGQSMPTFWIGIMLIVFVAARTGWLPTSGYGGIDNLVLPTLTLAFAQIALISRLTRSSVLDVVSQDYLRTARSKGIGENRVIFAHGLRNAVLPVITMLGLQLGALLGGAVVTEAVFGWPGIGSLLVSAISSRDYPVVQVVILLSAAIFILVNLLLDLLYGVLDPRIKLRGRAS